MKIGNRKALKNARNNMTQRGARNTDDLDGKGTRPRERDKSAEHGIRDNENSNGGRRKGGWQAKARGKKAAEGSQARFQRVAAWNKTLRRREKDSPNVRFGDQWQSFENVRGEAGIPRGRGRGIERQPHLVSAFLALSLIRRYFKFLYIFRRVHVYDFIYTYLEFFMPSKTRRLDMVCLNLGEIRV